MGASFDLWLCPFLGIEIDQNTGGGAIFSERPCCRGVSRNVNQAGTLRCLGCSMPFVTYFLEIRKDTPVRGANGWRPSGEAGSNRRDRSPPKAAPTQELVLSSIFGDKAFRVVRADVGGGGRPAAGVATVRWEVDAELEFDGRAGISSDSTITILFQEGKRFAISAAGAVCSWSC